MLNTYHYIYGFILMLLLASCSPSPSKMTVSGVFNEDCDFICEGRKYNGDLVGISCINIEKSPIKQDINFPLNDGNWKNVKKFIFTLNYGKPNSITIQSIELEGIYKQINDSQSTNSSNFLLNNESRSSNKAISTSSFEISVHSFYQEWQKKYTTIALAIYLILLILYLIFHTINDKKKSIIPIFISIYIISLPLKISWSNWALTIFAIITIYLFITKKDRSFKLQKPFYLILFIYVPILIGTLYSANPQSIQKLNTVAPLAILPLLFSMISLDNKETSTILKFSTFNTILLCLYLLILFIIILPINIDSLDFNPKNYSHFLLSIPIFNHPSFTSIIIIMTIPITIYLNKKGKLKWPFLFLTIILICIVVSLTGARIGLIIVPLLLILSILFYIKIKPSIKFFVVGICLLCGSIVYINFGFLKESVKDPIRYDLRLTAITAFKDKPLFGWGTDSMSTLLHSEYIAHKAGLKTPLAVYNHFHNQYLDMLVQFGIIGSLPFFALFIYIIYLAIRRKDFLLMSYLAIYLPFMYVESPFATVKGIQPMIFWLCFLLSTQKIRLERITPNIEEEL